MAQHESSDTNSDSAPNPETLPDATEAEALIHDLGTPLTIISGYVQLLRRRNLLKDGSDAALDRSLEAMEGAIDRMKKIVSEHRRQQTNGDRNPDNDRP